MYAQSSFSSGTLANKWAAIPGKGRAPPGEEVCAMRRLLILIAICHLCTTPAAGQLRSTTPFTLNSTAASDASSADLGPTVCSDGAGNWVAVWSSTYNLGGTIGTDFDLFVSRSSDDAATWTSAAVLNSTAASDGGGDDAATVLATNGTGTWLAMWHSNHNLGGTLGGDYEIFVSRSTDNGAAWSSVSVVNSTASADSGANDFAASVAWAGGSNWVATWYTPHDLSGGSSTDNDIAFAISSDDGVTWTAAAHLNSTATTDGTANDQNSRVASDGQGNVIAVWNSNFNLGGSIGTDNDIFIATSSDHGATWSATAALNSNAASDGGLSDADAVIATDGAGTWIAGWRSQWAATGSDNEIICQRSTNNGGSWTSAALVNNTASTDGSAADLDQRIVASGPGVFSIAWISANTADGNSDNDVLVSTTNDGGATWSKVTYLHDTAYNDSTSPDDYLCIGSDGTGGFFSAFRSTYDLGGAIGTDTDIFGLKFTPDFTAPAAVGITPVTTGPTNADSLNFTVSFDQDVTGFNAEADLLITHSGTTHSGVAFSGGPADYTVTLNNVAGDGNITLAVIPGAGVQNNLSVSLGSSVTSAAVSVDNTGPAPLLSASAGDPVGGAFTVAVDTGESTTGFDLGDCTPINGAVSAFAGAGSAYTFSLAPSASPASVSIAAGAYTDAAGNPSTASNVVSRNYDAALPSVTAITPATTGPSNAAGIDFTVEFDEAVQNFNNATDLTLAHNGTASTGAVISGGPLVYTVSVTGVSGDGSFTLAVNPGSDVQDLASNALASSVTSAAVVIDNTAPAFNGITADPAEASPGDVVTISFTTDDIIAGDPDVTVNGNPATRTAKAAYTYEYTVLPSDAYGAASIDVSAVDVAGNAGMSNSAAALTIVPAPIEVPLAGWPVGLALLCAGCAALRGRGRQ
jgi:hypothetical protein